MAAAATAVLLLWPRFRAHSLPAIPVSQLDANAQALVQQHLDAVRTQPRSGVAWGRLGVVLRLFDFRGEARYCLAQAEHLDPQEPRWPYFHGLLLHYQSPPEAMAMLKRAVALCGNHPPAPRLWLARLLAENGQWEEASRELEELLRAEPDDPSALLALAQATQARGDITNAMALAGRCTTSACTTRAAWTLLSALHQRLGDTNAALLASRKALLASPDVPAPDPFETEFQTLRGDARSLSDQAQKNLLARNLDEAAPLIRRLEREHPQFAETWLLSGRLLYLRRQPAAAAEALRRHLKMDPQSLQGQFQLGMSLLALEHWIEAAACFEKATQWKADFGPAFFNRGMALVMAGRMLEAVPPFREAIRHNPEYIDSYIALADLSLQLGRKADAVDLEQRARELNPDDRRLAGLRDKIARY